MSIKHYQCPACSDQNLPDSLLPFIFSFINEFVQGGREPGSRLFVCIFGTGLLHHVHDIVCWTFLVIDSADNYIIV